MKSEVAGDPVRDLRWTRKTTMKIAGELMKLDLKVGARMVAKLLKSMGFSLKTARRSLLSGIQTGPEYRNQRNQQVRKIEKMQANFTTAGLPMISIDCKKKEWIGRFKNPGKVLCRKVSEVLDHDYRPDAIGTAVPYGIYDVNRNHGTVVVGDSRETAAFASDALERWWVLEGRQAYPDAKSLLVLADCGGGNGARVRAWKRALQGKMADRYGLSIIVCHWPPVASKWNPIEHRLFSQISRNWAGVTLESYETVLNYIGTTTTDKGLTVRAVMHSQQYETGERVSDTEMKSLRCRKHKELPKWNYTIEPRGDFAKIAA